MTNNQIDKALETWLSELGERWDWSTQYTADHLDDDYDEIHNRETWYPKLALLLRQDNWAIADFKEIASNCFTLNEQFFAIRLNRMLTDKYKAQRAIYDLLKFSPENTSEIIDAINNFVDATVNLGFMNSNKHRDNAGAALLASVLLTALFPWKFVDYRTQRWNRFAKLLGYPKPPAKSSFGEKILWAGDFAKEISQTPTFEEYWSHQGEPFWVIAGLCWHGPEPEKPTYIEEGFSEGRVIERRHKIHERNSQIVNEAKELAYDKDPLLRCEVCGFSFVETYGERGEQFIEAHHMIPLAELKEKTKNKVEDLVLVCSNCHVMIHRKYPTLTLDELREMLQ